MSEQEDLHLAFPLSIVNGLPAQVDFQTYVAMLIEQALLTLQGQRVNRPDFGCGVMQLVMQPISEQLVAATQFTIQSQLQQATAGYAAINNVTATANGDELVITVAYTISSNGNSANLTVRQTLFQEVLP